MPRFITARFDSRDAAARAVVSLRGLGARDIRTDVAEDHGTLAAVASIFLPDDDRAKDEARRASGATTVSAEVEESALDAATEAMRAAGAEDLDTRAEEWRGSGWVGAAPGMAAGTGLTGTDDPAGTDAPDDGGQDSAAGGPAPPIRR